MPTKKIPTRGRWEATLLNIRTLKTRLTKLEARVEKLENPSTSPTEPTK